jgi:hypothetical protein
MGFETVHTLNPVLATLLIHRIWFEFRAVIAVLPANSRAREPAGDRIRKQRTEDPQKVDILGPQPITNGVLATSLMPAPIY